MATALPPIGPLNLDTGLQGPHFQKQETKDSNAPTLYGNDGEIENARLLTPCSPDTPIEELRRRYWRDGVIWISLCLDDYEDTNIPRRLRASSIPTLSTTSAPHTSP